jgi:hypothetical protein
VHRGNRQLNELLLMLGSHPRHRTRCRRSFRTTAGTSKQIAGEFRALTVAHPDI